MRTNSDSRTLAALVAATGFVVCASFVGCGGDGTAFTGRPAGTGTGGKGGESVGGSSNGGMGGSGGAAGDVCGDKLVGDTEACDDGNMISGDGCEADCSFTCNNASPISGDAKCDDQDPCNGVEKCMDDHTCSQDKPAPDGTSCGNAKICIGSICLDDTCGDKFVSMTEECDDGNVDIGDGCDNCKFSCLSTDATRNCKNFDPCVATACDDASHTCGTPIAEGLSCGMNQACHSGMCVPTVCGDGTIEYNEVCDDGNLIDGDGCDKDCTLSCVNPATDCAKPPSCQQAVCVNAQCSTTNLAVDPTCAAPSTCQNGTCTAPNAVCGNGIVETGEDCDFGMQNAPGSGCEINCKFSCANDAACNDMNQCTGTETCANVTVGGKAGKKCAAGMSQASCSACAGGLCVGGTCTASTCGDGCLDMTAGEQCEPPGTATCDAMCKTIAAVVCGDGVRGAGEQCDDGNTANIDGCDATCKFEQVHRVNWLSMQFVTDTYCTANRLGDAIKSQGQGPISQSLTTGVNDGSISIMFKLMGLDDLTGTTDPTIGLGSLNGVPVIPMGAMYNGASDLDWWYTIDLLSLDANRTPTAILNGSIAAKTLTAGPGPLTINLALGGAVSPLKMSSARLTTAVGATSVPLASMTGTTPGHLPGENLDPALTSFQSMGQPTATGAGKLCGNVAAASLRLVPIPAQLLSGATACNQGYTASNSLLDAIVGGCSVTFLNIVVIAASQPDQQDPNAQDAGAGFPYTLTRNAATKAVDGCRDKNNQVAPFDLCLADAAYSSFFKFTTDRVIAK